MEDVIPAELNQLPLFHTEHRIGQARKSGPFNLHHPLLQYDTGVVAAGRHQKLGSDVSYHPVRRVDGKSGLTPVRLSIRLEESLSFEGHLNGAYSTHPVGKDRILIQNDAGAIGEAQDLLLLFTSDHSPLF